MDATEFIGNNLTLDTVRNSPSKKFVVLSAGAAKIMQDNKRKLAILIEIDGRNLEWIPNKTSIQNVMEKYGKETQEWVGKVFKVKAGVVNGKDAVIVTPDNPL